MVWVHLVKDFGHSCLKMIIFVDDGTRVYGLVHFDVALPAGGGVGCAHARTARCGAVVRARATRGGTRAGARGDRRRRGGAAELGHTSASLLAAAAPLSLPLGARVRVGRARSARRDERAGPPPAPSAGGTLPRSWQGQSLQPPRQCRRPCAACRRWRAGAESRPSATRARVGRAPRASGATARERAETADARERGAARTMPSETGWSSTPPPCSSYTIR